MDASLLELLRGSQSEDGTYTHISFYGPSLKWNIRSHDLPNFWKTYCKLISSKDGRYCLAEKAQEILPVVVRGTFQFSEVDSESFVPYQDDFLLALVYCFQQAMIELLDIDTPGKLICCVLESRKAWMTSANAVSASTNPQVCYTWALQFPFLRIEANFQKNVLRPRVIQLLRQHKVLDRLSEHPDNTQWDTVLDPLIPGDPWPMYGSTRTPTESKLDLTHIYPKLNPPDEEQDNEPELSEVFVVENHSHVQQCLLKPSMFVDESGQVDHNLWLPMFLSLHYWNQITVVKAQTTVNTPSRSNSSTRSSVSTFAKVDATELEIADTLIQMLSLERLEKDHYWMDVGKSLYNLDRGGETGLNIWIRYTERSDNHDANDCRCLYPTFNIGNTLTLKTLAWYAREDSKDLYEEWHDKWCYPVMEKALSCIHTDVAIALYRYFWLEYLYSSTEKRWYYFSQHRWHRLDDGLELRKGISSQFVKRFEMLRLQLGRQKMECQVPADQDRIEDSIKKVTNLIAKLKTVTFKSNLMREATEHFHDAKFAEKADADTDTMGLLNGIIETCNSYATFRPGKPEDFITKSSTVFFCEDYHWKHPHVEKCMKWLRQVFPEDELLNYFLKLAASCLKGRNMDKLFVIWTGEGDNSKSMIKKLFECAFGNYSFTFPPTVLTGKRTSSSGPTPELALAASTRVNFLQEPSKEDTIRDGALKELTGGDTLFARKCNQDGGVIETHFKLFYLCNKVPVIPNSDKAVRNRLRILPFLSKWVRNAPETEEEQMRQRTFKMDSDFINKIPPFAPAFLWILVQKFSNYRLDGLRQPEIITKHTEEYWEENDPIQQFIKETIESVTIEKNGIKEPNPDVKLGVTDIYNEYSHWFRESFQGLKVPDRNSVKYSFTEKWGKPTRVGWTGIKFKNRGVDLDGPNGASLGSLLRKGNGGDGGSNNGSNGGIVKQ